MLVGLRTTEEHFFAQSRALRRGSEVADLPSIEQPSSALLLRALSSGTPKHAFLVSQLERLESYHRRAFSRRKPVIKNFQRMKPSGLYC
jgi:hypothetical protein